MEEDNTLMTAINCRLPSEQKRTPYQSRLYLSLAQKMNDKFPEFSLTECVKIISDEYRKIWIERQQKKREAEFAKTFTTTIDC